MDTIKNSKPLKNPSSKFKIAAYLLLALACITSIIIRVTFNCYTNFYPIVLIFPSSSIILSLVLEVVALIYAKKSSMPLKQILGRIGVYLLLFLLTLIIISLVFLNVCNGGNYHARDFRIKTSMSQMKTEMLAEFNNKGNYDSFNLDNPYRVDDPEKKWIMEDLWGNVYHGTQPVVARVPSINSSQACFFATLNEKRGQTWFCVDSSGGAGETNVNPSSPGYCVDGISAKCPPIVGD